MELVALFFRPVKKCINAVTSPVLLNTAVVAFEFFVVLKVDVNVGVCDMRGLWAAEL